MSDNYFTFPLAALQGLPRKNGRVRKAITPHRCLNIALDCGILGAGIGYRHHHGDEAFRAKYDDVCEEMRVDGAIYRRTKEKLMEFIVGAAICQVDLGHPSCPRLQEMCGNVELFGKGPLVRMSGDAFWGAFYQTRADETGEESNRDRVVSWREFRVLCAILSAKRNRSEFAFIGWETIQARSCGYTRKEDFKNAESIPDHLAPPFSHKQIRTTCDTLEALGFFARFRLSSGVRGGLMAYSVRHSRDELAEAVCENANFRDRLSVRKNREADALKCLQLLERTKSGQSQSNVDGKGGGKGGGKHNEKSKSYKSPNEKSKRELPPNPQGG